MYVKCLESWLRVQTLSFVLITEFAVLEAFCLTLVKKNHQNEDRRKLTIFILHMR